MGVGAAGTAVGVGGIGVGVGGTGVGEGSSVGVASSVGVGGVCVSVGTVASCVVVVGVASCSAVVGVMTAVTVLLVVCTAFGGGNALPRATSEHIQRKNTPTKAPHPTPNCARLLNPR